MALNKNNRNWLIAFSIVILLIMLIDFLVARLLS